MPGATNCKSLQWHNWIKIKSKSDDLKIRNKKSPFFQRSLVETASKKSQCKWKGQDEGQNLFLWNWGSELALKLTFFRMVHFSAKCWKDNCRYWLVQLSGLLMHILQKISIVGSLNSTDPMYKRRLTGRRDVFCIYLCILIRGRIMKKGWICY